MEKRRVIRVNVQRNGMVALHQGRSTIMVNNVPSLIRDLAKTKKRRHSVDKLEKRTRNIQIDEISYQPEKLYASAVIEILAKDIVQEIYATANNNCEGCINIVNNEPHNQMTHETCQLLPSEKAEVFFDDAFRKMDMYSANDESFEKVKDQIANSCSKHRLLFNS